MKLKSITLLLLALFVSLFTTGCEKEKDKPKELSAKTKMDIVVNNYDRPFPPGLNENNNPYLSFIEENTNLDLNVIVPPEDGYMERLNVLMASNHPPELIYGTDPYWFINNVNQNALTPLTNILKKHGKNLIELIPEEAWQNVSINGEIYAIPHILQNNGNEIMYVRKDWLDKEGLAPPVTLEEYIEVMKAFKSTDANSIGLLIGQDLMRTAPFFGAFGIQPNQWIEKEGKLIYSSTTNEMRDALRFLTNLYQKGLLDSEFPLNTLASLEEKIVNGQVGLFAAAWWDTRGPILGNKQQDVNAKWISLEYPLGPKGHRGTVGESIIRGYNIVPISQSEKAEEVVQLLDFLVTDGFRNILLGFEGDIWEMVDGKAIADFHKHNLHLYRHMYNIVDPSDHETMKIRLDSLGLQFKLNENVKIIQDHVMNSQYNGPPTPAMGRFGNSLKELEVDYFTKIIMGIYPISHFDQFVSRWYNEGGKEIEAEVNQWYAYNKTDNIKNLLTVTK